MSKKKRNSYCSMTKEQFLDPETGQFKRLDGSAWYIKNKNNEPCYFLNMHTKFQQMPKACFEATAAASPLLDVDVIKKDIAKFMEANDGK